MNNRIEIRTAEPRDAALTFIAREALGVKSGASEPRPRAGQRSDANDAQRRAAFVERFRPDAFRIVVVDGRDAGVCRVANDAEGVEVSQIALLPTYRAPEIVEAAIGHFQQEARAADCALRLKIGAREVDAIRRAAERLGFVVEKASARTALLIDHSREDERWMREALAEARRGSARDETPVGAVIVEGGRIVGRGHNAPIARHDPTAHAEIAAIRQAAAALAVQRLDGCALYVTVEPCAMCAGAILLARIERLVFGARNEKFGACGSQCDLPAMAAWNHRVAVRGGVLAREAAEAMRGFFADKRRKGRQTI